MNQDANSPALRRLSELLAALELEPHSDEYQQELNDLLLADETARQSYIEYIQTSALLERELPAEHVTVWSHDLQQPHPVVDKGLAVIIDVNPANLSRRNKRFDTIHWQRHRFRFGTFSAVLTALAWAGFGFVMGLNQLIDNSHPNRTGEDYNFVARITGQHEHQWDEDMQGMPWNAFLLSGERLILDEGLIEITFYNGAVVVLEGPARFVVDANGAGTVEEGKLVGRVGPSVTGLQITTPTAVITDLGTEFGVWVNDRGETDIHVIEGMVDVLPSSHPNAVAQRLTADSAIRVERGGYVTIPFQGEALRRELPDDFLRPHADAVLIAFQAEAWTSNIGTTGFLTINDADALGGQYITTGADDTVIPPAVALATYSLNITEPGPYTLYGRFLVEDYDGGNDSLFVDKTIGVGETWGNFGTLQNPASDGLTYFWVNLSAATDVNGSGNNPSGPVGTYNVPSSGVIDFDIGGREDGLRIDAFVLSTTDDLSGAELDASFAAEPEIDPLLPADSL